MMVVVVMMVMMIAEPARRHNEHTGRVSRIGAVVMVMMVVVMIKLGQLYIFIRRWIWPGFDRPEQFDGVRNRLEKIGKGIGSQDIDRGRIGGRRSLGGAERPKRCHSPQKSSYLRFHNFLLQ